MKVKPAAGRNKSFSEKVILQVFKVLNSRKHKQHIFIRRESGTLSKTDLLSALIFSQTYLVQWLKAGSVETKFPKAAALLVRLKRGNVDFVSPTSPLLKLKSNIWVFRVEETQNNTIGNVNTDSLKYVNDFHRMCHVKGRLSSSITVVPQLFIYGIFNKIQEKGFLKMSFLELLVGFKEDLQ